MEKPPFSQKKRSASSQRWLQRQRKDIFVQEAQKKNYRSRSALKLLQIQEKYKFLKPQEKVLDLGCAPGGWCQVVQEILSKKQKKNFITSNCWGRYSKDGSNFRGNIFARRYFENRFIRTSACHGTVWVSCGA